MDIYHCYASPYPRTFTASNIITFRADTLLSSIKLNADQTSLQINAAGMAADSFIHDQDTLTIMLDRTYQPGEIASVSIEYEHLDVPDLAFYVGNGFVFTDYHHCCDRHCCSRPFCLRTFFNKEARGNN